MGGNVASCNKCWKERLVNLGDGLVCCADCGEYADANPQDWCETCGYFIEKTYEYDNALHIKGLCRRCNTSQWHQIKTSKYLGKEQCQCGTEFSTHEIELEYTIIKLGYCDKCEDEYPIAVRMKHAK